MRFIQEINMNQTMADQQIKVYVTLRKSYEGEEDYKRLTLLIDGNLKISDLKRQIEREFADLFPYEPPYIVAKLDDEYGYSLSNGSRIGDFLKFGDRITAQPENLAGEDGGRNPAQLHGGASTEDLINMLRNLQTSIIGKVATSNLGGYSNIQEILEAVIPLGFFRANKQVIHNMCLIMSKCLDPAKVRLVYDNPDNGVLVDLTLQMIKLWVDEFVEQDSFILGSVVELLETLLNSQRIWQQLKQLPIITAKLLNISKKTSINAFVKTKIVQIASHASKPYYQTPVVTAIAPVSGMHPYQQSMPQQRSMEEQKNGYGTSPFGMSYTIDTAYQGAGFQQQREPTKSYNQQQLKIMSKMRDSFNQGRGNLEELYISNRMIHMEVEEFNSILMSSIAIKQGFRALIDYCQMLTPENSRDMQVFGMQSLDQMIDEAIRKIMGKADLLMKVMCLTEYFGFPFDIQQSQYRILTKVADYMNEARAGELIRENYLNRLLKNLSQHNSRFQPIVTNLITKIVSVGRANLDVKTLFALSVMPSSGALASLQDLALKGLVDLSDNKKLEEQKMGASSRKIDNEFENYVPHLVQMSKDSVKFPSDYLRQSALQVLANLSLRDYLRPLLFTHRALELFLEIVKSSSQSMSSVENARIAAKGLVNLVSSRKEIRMQVVAELSEEIKLIYRNQLDQVVASFIQTLLHQKS